VKPTRKSNPEWVQALGRRIAALRDEKGWSQDALATAAVMDRSQLCDIELGKAEAKIGTLRAIAGALGITVSKLLENIPSFDPP
jgi:transcriptional regulator with XRE-family HTH domain